MRFYEENKDNLSNTRNGISVEEIEKLIEEKFKSLKSKSEESATDD